MESPLAIDIAFHALMFIAYLAFWGVVFVTLYHFTRFGIGVQPKRMAGALFFGSIVLFCASILFFAKVDLGIILQ